MYFTIDLEEPESPVVLPDRSWLVAEMSVGRGRVTRISPDGSQKWIVARTGRPNGLALDRNGTIWVAESRDPALLRLSIDGTYGIFLRECHGVPFMFPNDLCFGPDGLLYLTDSGIYFNDYAPGGQLRSDYLLAPIDGRVYQINTSSREIHMIDRGLRFPNGIAIGPDNFLYVNETLTGFVYKYALSDRKVGPRQYFGNVIDPNAPPGYKGPDGMKFGLDSNLYVAVFGQQDITVLGCDGSVIRRIRTQGKMPTNIAFGPEHEKRIFITEMEFKGIEVLDIDTEGFPLFR